MDLSLDDHLFFFNFSDVTIYRGWEESGRTTNKDTHKKHVGLSLSLFFSVKALVCVCSLYRTKKIPFGNHADTCYIRSREEGNVTTITLDVFRLAGYPLEFFDNGAAITHTAHKDRFICFFFFLPLQIKRDHL